MSAIDLAALAARDRRGPLTATEIARPIAWATTMGARGVADAAPCSSLDLLGRDPAPAALGPEPRLDGSPEDTTRDVAAPGGLAAAAPGPAQAPVADAAPRPAGAWRRSSAAGRRRLSRAGEIVGAEAAALHARDGLVDLDGRRVERGGDLPIARLLAGRYARLTEMARRAIPQPEARA